MLSCSLLIVLFYFLVVVVVASVVVVVVVVFKVGKAQLSAKDVLASEVVCAGAFPHDPKPR